jgi:hypothetical protein
MPDLTTQEMRNAQVWSLGSESREGFAQLAQSDLAHE